LNADRIAVLADIRDGIRAQPGRVGLSFFAIGVGVTALTVLLALLGGLRERAQRIVQDLGVNVFGIAQSPSGDRPRSARVLRERHVRLLRANLPHARVSGVRVHDVPAQGMEGRLRVVAADAELCAVRQWRIRAGRFIDEEDLSSHARVAVVGTALGRLWNAGIGATVTLRETPYRIVGIVETGGDAIDSDFGAGVTPGESVVFVPVATPPYWQTFERQDDRIDAIFVRVPEAERFRATVRHASNLLSHPDGAADDLSWITPELLLRRVHQLQRTVRFAVGGIAALCLILGGTTLMSLMVANVRDRVTEIGLRRALGATPRDIATLFVLEGCLVTTAAASAGVLLTHALILAGGTRWPAPVRTGPITLLVPLGVSIGLGIAFSYWPARLAARIAPSEALRND
jgi:putative ABC transport system permease protein